MSADLLDPTAIDSASRFANDKQGILLAAYTEELARLRFSIILTAKWEASEAEDMSRRNELRAELADLRRRFFEKIDEIAMTFGVQTAIDAQEGVERSVIIPPGGWLMSIVRPGGKARS